MLRPEVLQQHPNKFLNKLIHISQGRIKTILQGGHSEDIHDQASPEEVSVRHISCYEGYVPKYPVEQKGYNTDTLQRIVDRNKAKGSAYCIKIMGLVVYAAHKWRDKVFLKKHKPCEHSLECPSRLNYYNPEKFTGHSRSTPLEDQ